MPKKNDVHWKKATCQKKTIHKQNFSFLSKKKASKAKISGKKFVKKGTKAKSEKNCQKKAPRQKKGIKKKGTGGVLCLKFCNLEHINLNVWNRELCIYIELDILNRGKSGVNRFKEVRCRREAVIERQGINYRKQKTKLHSLKV